MRKILIGVVLATALALTNGVSAKAYTTEYSSSIVSLTFKSGKSSIAGVHLRSIRTLTPDEGFALESVHCFAYVSKKSTKSSKTVAKKRAVLACAKSEAALGTLFTYAIVKSTSTKSLLSKVRIQATYSKRVADAADYAFWNSEIKYYKGLISYANADILELLAERKSLEFQKMIAEQYGDILNSMKIVALIAKLDLEIDELRNDIAGYQAEIDQYNALIIKG